MRYFHILNFINFILFQSKFTKLKPKKFVKFELRNYDAYSYGGRGEVVVH